MDQHRDVLTVPTRLIQEKVLSLLKAKQCDGLKATVIRVLEKKPDLEFDLIGNGGELKIESELGKGSRFTLIFPASRVVLATED